MDYEQLQQNYEQLQIKYDQLLTDYDQLKLHLKKYTAPERKKKYYEKHKEEIKNKSKGYREKTGYKVDVSAEKRKEYNKRAYEKRRQKIENNN